MIRRLRRAVAGPERGFTLIEMLVAVALFAIFITVALAALLRLTSSTVTAQERARGSSDALVVFQNLDRQVRYANSINYPGVSNGQAYVEFLTAAGQSPTNVDTCTQWRYNPTAGIMQVRQWANSSTPTYGTWQTKATDLKNAASATVPFALLPAVPTGTGTGIGFQRLKVHVDIGGPKLSDQTSVDTTFLARNSSIQSPSNVGSAAAGSTTPVCAPTGYRP